MPGTNLGTAYVQIMPSAKGISGMISKELSGEAANAGESTGNALISKLKGVIAAAGLGEFLKKSLEAGGDIQQSFGGLDTLYGDAAKYAKKYAVEASKAGISANEYAEQAVSFGAALKQSYGGDTILAMASANKAIMDMADNSAKMGTDIGSIQTAYQGFAKQNYTMLDNLKLGYGGTKEEMERLLADAEKLSGVHYNIDNLGEVYSAIHVIQEDLGLTGVAAQEAQTTFTGSFGAMQAAATNFLASLSLGEGVGPALTTLIETAKTFLIGNLFPMVGNIIMSLPEVIGTFIQATVPSILEGINIIPQILDSITQQLPGVLEKGVEFITNFANGIFESSPDAILKFGEIITNIYDFILTNGPVILEKGVELIGNLAAGFVQNLPAIIDAMQQVAADMLNTLINHLPEMLQAGKDIITKIGEGVTSLIQHLPDLLKQIADNALNNFKSIDWKGLGSTVIDFIKSGIDSIKPTVWENLKSIGQTAYDNFKSIDWKGLGSAIIDFIVNGISSIGSTIWNTVKGLGQDAYDNFKGIDWVGLGIDVINYIIDGLFSIGGNIADTLSGLASDAWNSFASMDWWSLGMDIVNGIIGGVNGGSPSLWGTMTSLASSALDAACSWLGIGSPSKVFRDQVGKQIDAGIALGIDGSASEVTNSIEALASDSVNAFDVGTFGIDSRSMGAVAAPAGGVTIPINVYASDGMDVVQLANKVSDVLALQLKQAQAVWSM